MGTVLCTRYRVQCKLVTNDKGTIPVLAPVCRGMSFWYPALYDQHKSTTQVPKILISSTVWYQVLTVPILLPTDMAGR
jgi:hypothetical protein